MNKILNAIVAVFLFQTYTDMPRWMEIIYGVLVWFGMAIIIYSFTK